MMMEIKTRGNGPPLLMIAGLGGDAESWAPVAARLATRFRVITFDNRGVGSRVQEANFTIEDMAADACEALQSLKLERAHVLGHSMGGFVAQCMAIRFPSFVDRLILESTAPRLSMRNQRLFRDFVRGRRVPGGLDDWVRRWAFWLFARGWFDRPDRLDEFVAGTCAYPQLQTTEGFEAQVRAMDGFDARPLLSSIRAKTLVLAGEEDLLFPLDETRGLADAIPGARWVPVKGAAHLMHLEQPEAFDRAMGNHSLAGG